MQNLISLEQDDPYNLDIKLSLIKEYRKINYMIEAAEVRERYLEISPLTEEMWSEWIQDLPSSILYERALKDFYCKFYIDPTLLSSYLETVEPSRLHMIFASVKEFCRDTDVWLAYILRLDDNDVIRSMYRELFSIPRLYMDKAWKFYESWEVIDESKQQMQELYLKNFALWISEEENYISAQKSEDYSIEKLKSYFEAIKPTQRVYIFEEILLRFPKSWEIWMEYLTSMISDRAKARQIAKRSVRNCPSAPALWSLLFLCYEQSEKPIESNLYLEKFQTAITCAFPEGNDYTKLWREYSQNVNRRGGDYIYTLIQGEEWLQSSCPPQHLALKAYRAQITNDTSLFEEIVREHGSSASVWEVYIKYLEEKKDPRLRQVYLRGIEYTKDNPMLLINRYLEWENRFGSVQDIIQARIKTHKRISRDVEPAKVKTEKFKIKATKAATRYTAYISNVPVNIKEHQLEEIFKQVVRVKAVRIVRDRKGNSRGFAYCDFENEEDLINAVAVLQGKDIQGNHIGIAISKPPEDNPNENLTVFVNNLPFEINENELAESMQEFGNLKKIRIIKGTDGKCKGYAYAEFYNENSIEAACLKEHMQIKNRRVLLQRFNAEREQKFILHVTNLPYTIEESEVLELFPGAASVSIPKDKLGKSRGFGFIQFTTEADAVSVLEKENPCLNGRHLVVKRSFQKPPEKKPLNNTEFKKFLG